jgi:hypothetical protein
VENCTPHKSGHTNTLRINLRAGASHQHHNAISKSDQSR